MRPIVVTVTDASGGPKGSALVRLDEWAPAALMVQCNATGTVDYDVQYSLDDPNSPTDPVAEADMQWTTYTDGDGETADVTFQALFVPLFARILLNSGTGSVRATFVQNGVVPY